MTIKQRIILLISIIYGLMFTVPLTYACEPCASKLDAKESIDKSDLIIIGQKIADGPKSDADPAFFGPEYIEVKIIKVLKGDNKEDKILVNSWDGMCEYGIIVDEKSYVMLLEYYTDWESDGKIKVLTVQRQLLNELKDAEMPEEVRKSSEKEIETIDKKIKNVEETRVKYNAVDFGCAVKTFSVDNEMIDFEGKKISIDEFITKFNLNKTK